MSWSITVEAESYFLISCEFDDTAFVLHPIGVCVWGGESQIINTGTVVVGSGLTKMVK